MSRELILEKIQKSKSSIEVELPSIRGGVQFEDPLFTFAENVKLVGGEVLSVDELPDYILGLEKKYGAMKFLNTYLKVAFNNPLIPIQLLNPHDAERLDILMIEGEYGIAENGAVWVNETKQHPRSAIFLTQHLIICLKKSDILHNLHEFYKNIDLKDNFGTLISGPSKTADVEQCLVIGAHGSRSLGIVLID